ncbi:MAG TPA: hypothetical protein G4O05_08225 [Caldilineae bacterium]|nr:hypothetical protein [Caldilineae bacterium]
MSVPALEDGGRAGGRSRQREGDHAQGCGRGFQRRVDDLQDRHGQHGQAQGQPEEMMTLAG